MYQFISGPPPGKYKLFSESLYNTEQHRLLQASDSWVSFYVLNEIKKRVAASCHFNICDGVALSPYRAPFGGIELGSRLSKKILSDFVLYIESNLRKNDVRLITIKNQSRLTGPFDAVEQSFLHLGFQLEKSEMSSIISVDKIFQKGLHNSERKRMNKCIRSKFTVSQLPVRDVKTVYRFISECRTKKNYELSMSWPEMEKLVKNFPTEIIPFVVKDGDEIIAAAICVRVNKQVLYDFYHDHSPAYDQYSPVVFLMSAIHDYCQKHKIHWLDLGTSMVGDQINTGLHRFKLRLGAKPGVKNSFIKILV
jgi:hypothetical protein